MTTTLNEIKSQLARLLATEDLIVEHKPVETASFNVATRVLTLPVWDASENVYDMFNLENSPPKGADIEADGTVPRGFHIRDINNGKVFYLYSKDLKSFMNNIGAM